MNRLVYLYELDSVRNTETEIKIAQKALFREIVQYGNTVVLSFNQLTDSDAFHTLLMNDETYECVMTMFQHGALKVSRFGKYRTPSQFIQLSIDKCIKKEDDTFLFSGLPVKSSEKELLQLMKDALQYNDIAILEEYLENQKAEWEDEKSEGDEKEFTEIEKECMRIEFLIRYVKMLLLLSMESPAMNPPKLERSRSFTDYLDQMLELDYAGVLQLLNIKNDVFVERVHEALFILEQVYKNFRENEIEGIQSRSKWIDEIEVIGVAENANWKTRENEYDHYSMAIAIVEICYNYAIEDSICNVSKRYNIDEANSFEKDYVSNLYRYWNQILEDVHVPTVDEINSKRYVKVKVPWSTAVRVVVANYDNASEQDCSEKSREEMLYDYNFKREKRQWNGKIAKNLFLHFLYTGIYIVLFCVVQWAMGALEGLVSNTNILQGFWYDILVSMILFGILGSVVSEKTGLPDILESFMNILRGMKDFVYVFFAPHVEKLVSWWDKRRAV